MCSIQHALKRCSFYRTGCMVWSQITITQKKEVRSNRFLTLQLWVSGTRLKSRWLPLEALGVDTLLPLPASRGSRHSSAPGPILYPQSQLSIPSNHPDPSSYCVVVGVLFFSYKDTDYSSPLYYQSHLLVSRPFNQFCLQSPLCYTKEHVHVFRHMGTFGAVNNASRNSLST